VIAGRPSEFGGNRVTIAHDAEVAARGAEQHRAARVVAARSMDVDDCRELLGMLGLAGVTGLPVTDPPIRRG
jgi:RNase P/RNase MRP subunit p30